MDELAACLTQGHALDHRRSERGTMGFMPQPAVLIRLASRLVACGAVGLGLGPPLPQGSSGPPGPSPNDYVIDLATLAAGGEALLPAPEGRSMRLFLEDRVPSAAYSIEIQKIGSPGPVQVPPALPPASDWPGCAEGSLAEKRLWEAADEAQVPQLRGALEAVLARTECQPAETRVRTMLSRTRPLVIELALPESRGIVDVTVHRIGADGAAHEKTWRLHLSAPTDWAAVDQRAKDSFKAQAEAAAARDVSWRYRNEDEWLTGEVLQEMAAWVQRARGPGSEPAVKFPAPSQGPQAQKIEIAFGTDTVSMDVPSGGEHVWSPEAFRPDASALLTHFGLKAARPAKMPPSALGPLTDPRISVLLSENQRISAWLAKEPLSPEAHEQAALLLGAFGLREAAGSWSDTRSVMCAMTAHLGLAQGLRQGAPLGTDGVYASLVIDTLAERQRPTLLALASLAARAQGPEHAWNNALTLRNNHDWRMLKDAKDPTLLERLEEFRAFIEARGAIQALEYLESGKPDPLPDWGLIAASSPHEPTAPRLPKTLLPSLVLSLEREAIEAWKQVTSQEAPREQPLSVLNQNAVGADGVLTWVRWARFFENRLLDAAMATDLAQRMGGPRAGDDDVRQSARKDLAPLRGFPILDALWRLNRERGESLEEKAVVDSCAAAGALLRNRPELVPLSFWSSLEMGCVIERSRKSMPPPLKWLTRVVPRGTAYRAEDRLGAFAASLGSEEAASLHDLLLCNVRIWSLTSRYDVETLDSLRKSCGAVLLYNRFELRLVVALEDLTNWDDPTDRRRLCELEPGECDLPNRLIGSDQPQRASTPGRSATRR